MKELEPRFPVLGKLSCLERELSTEGGFAEPQDGLNQPRVTWRIFTAGFKALGLGFPWFVLRFSPSY